MKTLDMQGNPCPIPVVNAKKALAEPGADGVVVLVDNFVAVQNLEKMAKGTDCGFSYTEEGASLYKVTILKDPNKAFNEPPEAPATASDAPAVGSVKKGPVVLITADSMGRGAEDLGKLLIKGFIFSLTQLNPLPEAVIFLNGGAHLTTEGANTVPDLKVLQEKGTEVYTCGTCANYYKLTESLAVGSIVDMMKITNTLAKASGVITL
ncbi:sulfurtransferase-like selenium metabolism protein YedF [Treponema primitia]|uniref:sulfurtransferase-like selenium metabolism protein YedF n=1 Tax=Treponema primitia TaxID=88058 RepID=UPI00025556BB|nr:sulfurtransferase-like selenium metabolism protein YedF [Treponema primitia]